MSKIVTLFGSSVPREGSADYTTAYECGRLLADAGFAICNGGYAGIMEASARGARDAGGSTIGVTVAEWLRSPNRWIQQEIKRPTLIDRLMKLVELGDAYVVFRGGTGTLLEFACVLELVNKEMVERRPIVLFGNYWNGVLEVLHNEPTVEGQSEVTQLVHTVTDAPALVEYLKNALMR